jgi:hypothetical protein
VLGSYAALHTLKDNLVGSVRQNKNNIQFLAESVSVWTMKFIVPRSRYKKKSPLCVSLKDTVLVIKSPQTLLSLNLTLQSKANTCEERVFFYCFDLVLMSVLFCQHYCNINVRHLWSRNHKIYVTTKRVTVQSYFICSVLNNFIPNYLHFTTASKAFCT